MAVLISPAMLGGIAAALLLIAGLSSRIRTQRRYAALRAGPPAVVSSIFLGLDTIYGIFKSVLNHKFHIWTERLLKEHNHTVELRVMGQRLLMTDDPENIKAIQDSQFWDFAKSEEQHIIFKHILGDAIFAMNGEEWKAEAILYRAHMSRVRPTDLAMTEKHIVNAFALFEKDGAEGTDIIDRLELDVVTEVFCGESTNSLTENKQPFRDAMEVLQKVNSLRIIMGKLGVWLDVKYIAPKAVQFIVDYQEAMADKAFARSGEVSGPGPICLIDDLITKGKTRWDIKNAVTSTLLAGKDPTATTLAFAFYEVAKNPHVFTRMKAEVEEQIGLDKLPTLADLIKLKYIKMVIKETLRHHHPLGYNARVPVRDITLPRGGGPDGKSPAVVLKGTQILYSLITLQHREDIGPDRVNEWIPERWESWKPNNQWEYIPFNHGPRICPGQQFANFQMEYFFARFCQEFESITLEPYSKPQEGLIRLELNTKMAFPVYAKCIRRVKE